MTADAIIQKLNLAPHPEGGFYRQTWIADNDGRPVGTAIYFLLKDGGSSHWHTVDATEIWFYHAGAPLILSISETDAGPARDIRLGPDVLNGDQPQGIVQKGHWQAARTTGDYTLVSVTGFQLQRFSPRRAGIRHPARLASSFGLKYLGVWGSAPRRQLPIAKHIA